jgi:ParB-like chromosome segregation protein Spo0J
MKGGGTIEVELRALSSIQPYDRNAKRHPAAQVARIAESIREFGFNVPVLVDRDGVIVAGYGRYLAAGHLGLTHVPVVRLESLTPEQARKFRLADNKVAESSWDEGLLGEELL